MPTVESVLEEQQCLPELCADRPLVTEEICAFNAFYGLDTVLKTYAGVPLDRPLKLAVTHGIQMNEEYVWEAEISAPVPVILVYPERLLPAYRRKSRKVVVRTAAPFLYAQRTLKNELPAHRSGTLFFLSHSSHWFSAHVETERIVRHLRSLPADLHPVSVCIYWRDYLLGHHKPFEEAGFRIVSAGHMFDPGFLFRLCHLCAMHQYACSNELGSHLFYAVKAGCSYLHMNELEHPHNASLPIPEAVLARLEAEFTVLRAGLTSAQIAFVDEYVGADCLMSADEMREFLSFCERLDRYGAAAWDGQGFKRWPTLLKRALWLAPRRTAGRLVPASVRASLRRLAS